jgi:exodeoxyribonuclease X
VTNALPVALQGRSLAVADVEGNGQQPPDIVELAILAVDGPGDASDFRTWLVCPPRPITPIVRRIHGISNQDVEMCPPWSAIQGEVSNLLAERILIAHNANVEYRALGTHLPQWNPPTVLDTYKLAKHVWPKLKSHKLTELIAHAEIDTSGFNDQRPHRAGYDTWCAWLLLCALLGAKDLSWDELVKVACLKGFEPPAEEDGGLW